MVEMGDKEKILIKEIESLRQRVAELGIEGQVLKYHLSLG
jgi:hypothetical protein